MEKAISISRNVQLNGVRFDRCLTPPNAIGQPVLCVFSDASEDAFGACAYARWQLSTGGFDARFIAAKSRVAPLKKLTIPRLELQGAVLASRLGKTILKEARLSLRNQCSSWIARLCWHGSAVQQDDSNHSFQPELERSKIIQIPLSGDTSQES